MPTNIITFGSAVAFSGTYRIYRKARWADSWTLDERLLVTGLSIAAAPTIPTASFTYRYGQAREFNSATMVTRSRLSIEGHFIAIEVDCPEASTFHSWVGYVDAVSESERGATLVGANMIATGLQTFSCVGIVNALAFEQIDRTFFNNNTTGTQKAEMALSPPIFNRLIKDKLTDGDDRPEQSRADSKITEPPASTTALSFLHIFDRFYGRNSNGTVTYNSWSTKDIAEHLLDRYQPLDATGAKAIKFRWRAGSLDRLPTADQPMLDCTGKTLLQSLDELITGAKLIGYYAEHVIDAAVPWIELVTFTYASTAVDVGDYTIPANDDIVDLIMFADPATGYTTQFNLSQKYDQVIARGARRRVVATLNMKDTAGTPEPSVIRSWPTSLQTTDRQAKLDAIAAESDAVSSQSEKTEKYLAIYDSPQFFPVGSNFILRVNGWTGNRHFQIASHRLFEQQKDAEGNDQDYYPSPQYLRVLNDLPLLEGINYKNGFSQSALGLRPRRYLENQVFSPEFTQSGATFTAHATKKVYWGDRHKRTYFWKPSEPPFSIKGDPLDNACGVALKIEGASQYQLLFGDLSVPSSPFVPHLPHIATAQLQVTCCLEEDRQIESRWPTESTISAAAALDAVRRLIIDAPNCQKNRILEGTLLWTDQEVFSVASTQTIRDDTAKLTSLAKRASAWFTVPRRVLRVKTARTTSLVGLGKLVRNIENSTVQSLEINTVITQLSLTFDSTRGPSMEIETQSGQIDALAFVPAGWET